MDYLASTPCDPAVAEAMLPYLVGAFGNPASPHWAGREADRAVTVAREELALAVGCSSEEIIFTSGATESNNLAILGLSAISSPRRRIITSSIEHKSVLGPCSALRDQGFDIAHCPTTRDGTIDLGVLSSAIDDKTLLVSVQIANNEIGTIQPVREIAQLTHRAGAIFHTDAAQAFGKIPIDMVGMDVDLLSLSAHKCYGPKGVGALVVRGPLRRTKLRPLFRGGGQEHGLRPGTLNVPGIVGFGRAASIAASRVREEAVRIGLVRDLFETTLGQHSLAVAFNGQPDRRLPGSSSVTIEGIDADALLANLPELALSSGAACTDGTLEPSHVLVALGLTRALAYSTFRVGFGRFSCTSDAIYSARRIASVARQLLATPERRELPRND